MRFVTLSDRLRKAIFEYHPVAAEDPRAFRYVIYALHGRCDEETGFPLLGQVVLEWIDGKRLRGKRWGKQVLLDIKDWFPGMEWKSYIAGKKPRLLERDGLHPKLTALADDEQKQPKSELPERVFALSGDRYNRRAASAIRQELRARLAEEEYDAPSPTALYILRRMNDRHPKSFTQHILPIVPRAKEVLPCLDIGSDDEDVRERLRKMYRRTLSYIEDQPQPFYKFSENRRTDRIHPANPSALSLPKGLRNLLAQRFAQVDLRSAQLIIAAALWKCDDVLEKLTDEGYSIWFDLAEHFHLFEDGILESEWKVFKAACKQAIYSTIYGMGEPHIKGQFTRSASPALVLPDVFYRVNGEFVHQSEYASQRLSKHPVIRALLDARDVALDRIEQDGGAETATGIKAEMDSESRVNAASVMSTVAQSYEQEIMKEILLYEEEHQAGGGNDFRVMLWIHDGCAVHFTRRERTHLNAMKTRIAERSHELLGVAMTLDEERWESDDFDFGSNPSGDAEYGDNREEPTPPMNLFEEPNSHRD